MKVRLPKLLNMRIANTNITSDAMHLLRKRTTQYRTFSVYDQVKFDGYLFLRKVVECCDNGNYISFRVSSKEENKYTDYFHLSRINIEPKSRTRIRKIVLGER